MDIQAVILQFLEKNGQVKSAEVVKATGFSRTFVNRFFQELRDEGKIVLLGQANKAHYVPATTAAIKKANEKVRFAHRILENKDLFEHTVLKDIKMRTVIFEDIPDNLAMIVDYAFTEILNNAIEHSQSAKIEVFIEKSEHNLSFRMIDKGIGIFNNIMNTKGLDNVWEAIQDLLKGKQTTYPQAHSGEGIFFTSKIADIFTIQSGGKKLIFNNLIKDIFIKDIKNINGTKVFFSIDCASQKDLSEIFKKYTDDNFTFSRTDIHVRLYKTGVEYVSRSQARRILSGLDKFQKLILDFKNIDTVGQGFADEIFRVWISQHPGIEIEVINFNDNIQFMINRAKVSAK